MAERIDIVGAVAREGRTARKGKGHSGASALLGITAERERSKRHPVECVRKGEHLGASGRLTRKLHRRLDRVRTGRPREEHLIFKTSRLQEPRLDALEESDLGL